MGGALALMGLSQALMAQQMAVSGAMMTISAQQKMADTVADTGINMTKSNAKVMESASARV
jgi:hypothetical protein